MIDAEIKNMINEAYFSTKEILMNNKEKLTLLAEKLLEKEVIFRDDLETIFGKRPYETREQQLEQAEKTKEIDKPIEETETLVNEQTDTAAPESSI
jgi:cell division protease FtsH